VAERRKNAIIAKVSEVRWLNVSLAKLERIDAILQEADE
jgi:16S rRNA U1498 N3-methylase RsmE